jgi:hypothetical protein
VLCGQSRIVLGTDVAYLGPRNLRHQVPQPGRVDPNSEPAGGLGHEGHPVIQHVWQLTAIDLRPEVLGLPERCGVEGSGLDAVRPQLLQPAAELASRTGREGHRKHGCGVKGAAGDTEGDAVRDRSGLASAGSRNDRHWPVERSRDLTLLWVQLLQQRLGRTRWRRGSGHRDTISALTDDLIDSVRSR